MTLPTSRLNPVLQKRIGLALGIWGEAGIGKSHQVKTLLNTLACRTLSVHATRSLVTVAQSLPKPKKLPLWAESNLKRLTQGEAVESSSILDSLAAILSGLAPFVLHLEDIHEADKERLEFVTSLARMVQRIKGVALLVTSRQEPPEPFAAIKLEPLIKETSDQVVESELKGNVPKEALGWMYDKAAGNPLYTLEYLRYLTRQGYLWSDSKSWHWRTPPKDLMPVTVEALIEQLLNQAKTEPLQRYVLETKAFLLLETSDELIRKVARVNHEELQTAITELTQKGIFKDNTFAHPLFREVTLKTLSAERKRNLARRAMNVLEDNLEKVIPFIDDAGLTNEDALKILTRAQQQATERKDMAIVARLRCKAIEYAEGETQAQLTFEAAVAIYPYDLAEAIRLLKISHLKRPDNFDYIKWLAVCLAESGNRIEAEALVKNLSLEQLLNPQGLMLTIRIFHHLQEPKHVIDLWNAYPQLHASLKPVIVRDVAFSKAELGDAVGALELALQTLSRPHLTVEERVVLLETCGYAYQVKSDFTKAISCYSEAIELFRLDDQTHRAGSLLFNRAIAYQSLAQFSESIADAKEALRLADNGGHTLFYFNAQLALAIAQFEQGDYESAEKYLLECKAHYQQKNLTIWLVDTLVALSELYRDWGIPYAGTLSRKCASEALALASEATNSRIILSALPHSVMAEALFGEVHVALELTDEGITMCSNSDDELTKSRLMRGRAIALDKLGRSREAIDSLLQAVSRFQTAHLFLEAAKISLELDRLNNDIESARKRMEWFAERGLMNGVNIAKRYFPDLAENKKVGVAESKVRLEVLGTLLVTGDKTIPIRGQKRQELLARLLEARLSGRSEVPRLSLLDALYPDEDELKASSSLKVIVHNLRETFGESFLTTTNTGYALGSCSSDAEEFLQTGNISLWRGPYLEGLDLDESNVRESLYMTLYEKAKVLLDTNPQEVARVGHILVEADPYNVEYLRTYLTSLRHSKNHGKLTRHYQEAREHLLEVNETLPESWQTFLG